jgi:hypothetical protein
VERFRQLAFRDRAEQARQNQEPGDCPEDEQAGKDRERSSKKRPVYSDGLLL